MNKLFWVLLLLPFSNYGQTDSITLYYGKNQFDLNKRHKEKLIMNGLIEEIIVKGYTDASGSSAYNQWLSEKRASTVEKYLLEFSKDSFMVSSKGFGEIDAERIEPEDNPKNRRVDVLFKWRAVAEKLSSNLELLNKVDPTTPTTLEEEFEEVELGEKFVMKDLSFVPGQHILLKSSEPTLDSLAKILNQNPTLKIGIEGHICCEIRFEDGFDQLTGKRNLSIARAEYVYRELINKGIDPDRLTYAGFGRSQPLFPEELNERQKQANRRVEIRLIDR